MSVGYEIPEMLSYSAITPTMDQRVNWASFTPISGSTFAHSDTIKFRVNSNNSFLRPSKSFLRYKLNINMATTVTGNYTTSAAGLVAGTIDRVEEIVGGVRITDLDKYGAFISKLYQKAPKEYQNNLEVFECHNTTGSAILSTLGYSADATSLTGKVVCHALRTPIFECSQDLPLPFIRGGIEVNLYTGPVANLMTSAPSATDPSTYSISDVSLICAMVETPPSYLKQFQASLAGGGKAKIPLNITRHLTSQLIASTENHLQLSVGFLKSLNSMIGIFTETANLYSTDEYELQSRVGLTSYYLTNGSDRIPLDHEIGCSITTLDPTSAMYELCSIDNNFGGMNITPVKSLLTDTNFNIHMNFTPHFSAFGAGMTVKDGSVVLHLKADSAFASTDRLDSYWNYSAELSIGIDGITLNSANF